jgi:pilus assembly protein CpaE
MHEKQLIWIDGSSLDNCEIVKRSLQEQPDLDARMRIRRTGALEPPVFAPSLPRLVLLEMGEQGEQLLQEWSELSELKKIPLIVIGPGNNSQLMRRAMQVGARDYLALQSGPGELVASIRQVLRESVTSAGAMPGGKLTSIIDAKGGSGASFIACNLAHMLAAHLKRETALIDMDMQFGALPLTLDMSPRTTLFDAIGAAEGMDAMALRGYMAEHASGLHVLGTMGEQLIMPWEVSIESAQKVLRVALQSYAHVVADLPRSIDPMTSMVLAASDEVLVVMQRSFAHLRDAQRMYSLLRGYLGVPSARITLVINRDEGNSPISMDDIKDAIHPDYIALIPNDYVNVTESLNVGVPLYQGARNAPVTRSLLALAERLDGGSSVSPAEAVPAKRGLAHVFGLRG